MRNKGYLVALSVVVNSSASLVFHEADSSIVPVIRTDFSGSTIPIRVGDSNEPIQVQLSFVQSTSFLYSRESCPPFIDCFSGASSSSQSVDADIRVGSTAIHEYTFAIQIYEDDVRDTAGMLAFSPGSALARSLSARLSDEWFGYRHEGQTYRVGGLLFNLFNETTTTTNAPGSVVVPLLPITHLDNWSFQASSIRFNNEKVSVRPMRVMVDPTLSTVVIPYEFRTTIKDIIELQVEDIFEDSPSGDIYVPCSKDGPSKARLELQIDTPSGTTVIRPFLSPLFPLRKIVHAGTYFCQTHLRFGARLPTGLIDRHTWILGQPLFRERPGGVVFDARNDRMIIAPSGPNPSVTLRFSVLPVTMRMPRYDPNIIIERPNDSLTVLKFRQGANPDEGYVVRSRRLIGGRGVGMLDFSLRNVDDLRARKSGPGSAPGSAHELPGLYHILDDTSNLRFDNVENSISLYLTKAVSLDLPIYTVNLIHTSSISMISLRRVEDAIVDSGDLLLPDPIVVANKTSTTEEPTNSCCICLCDFEPGDSIQGLPNPCTHKFHEACIKQWFSNGKRNCPLCQSQVPIGRNPTISRPSPGPASAQHDGNEPSIYDVFASLLFAFDSQHMNDEDNESS